MLGFRPVPAQSAGSLCGELFRGKNRKSTSRTEPSTCQQCSPHLELSSLSPVPRGSTPQACMGDSRLEWRHRHVRRSRGASRNNEWGASKPSSPPDPAQPSPGPNWAPRLAIAPQCASRPPLCSPQPATRTSLAARHLSRQPLCTHREVPAQRHGAISSAGRSSSRQMRQQRDSAAAPPARTPTSRASCGAPSRGASSSPAMPGPLAGHSPTPRPQVLFRGHAPLAVSRARVRRRGGRGVQEELRLRPRA